MSLNMLLNWLLSSFAHTHTHMHAHTNSFVSFAFSSIWWCKLYKQSQSLKCFSAFTLSKEWQHLHALKDVFLTNNYLENCKMYQFINIKSKIFLLWICIIQYFSFCSLIVEYDCFFSSPFLLFVCVLPPLCNNYVQTVFKTWQECNLELNGV